MSQKPGYLVMSNKRSFAGQGPLVPQTGPETLPECPETLSRLQNPGT